jgi:hypothetical protein
VHPPEKFQRSPLCNNWSYGNKEYGIEVAFNVITSMLNLKQIDDSVQKLHHLSSLNVRHFGVIDIIFSGITSVQYFIQIHQVGQKLPTSEV